MDAPADGQIEVFFVCDCTGSMGTYITALRGVLPQVFALCDVLLCGRASCHLVTYEDYCSQPKERIVNYAGPSGLRKLAADLGPRGGGDAPEATKTGFVEVLKRRDPQKRCLVLHYTDAPPHHPSNDPSKGDAKTNAGKELAALGAQKNDWVWICKQFAELEIPCYTFCSTQVCGTFATASFYALLGTLIGLPDTTPEQVARATIGALLGVLGEPFAFFNLYSERHFTKPADVKKLKDEGKGCEGYLPGSGAADKPLVTTNPLVLQPLEWMRQDANAMVQKFASDEAFVGVVFNALRELFTKDAIECITYNSAVGKLWRLACKRRDDERLAELRNTLSLVVTQLKDPLLAQVKAWIDDSYNQTEEILAKCNACPADGVVLILSPAVDAAKAISAESLRSLARSPTNEALAAVQQLLTHVVLARTKPKDADTPYVPMAFSDKDLFCTLTHLVSPGTLFTLRPAALVAIVATLSGNQLLAQRADRFLQDIKGKWLPLDKPEDFPECFAATTTRLLLKVPQYLTDAELAVYQRLNRFSRLRSGRNEVYNINVGFEPKLSELTFDDKIACNSCHVRRSASLVLENGVCAFCELHREFPAEEPPGANVPEPAGADDTHSHLTQCRVARCGAIYAVCRPETLKVLPKCHYCRTGAPAPVVECSECFNKFVRPYDRKEGKKFVCPVCVRSNQPCTVERQVKMVELLEANPTILLRFGLKAEALQPLLSQMTLFKLHVSGELPALDLAQQEPCVSLVWGGKRVHRMEELLDVIYRHVMEGAHFGTCMLCFEDKPSVALHSACGNCANLICDGCAQGWWGQMKPGAIINLPNLLCPFCRQRPKGTVLRRFNRRACAILKVTAAADMQDWYYAWCVGCYGVLPHTQRVCARGMPELTDWCCEPCHARRTDTAVMIKAVKTKIVQCPACKAPVIKDGGCNHISCACGEHFCWACGVGGFDDGSIYEHIWDCENRDGDE